MVVLVTGAAGFIGAHVSRALLDRGVRVIGLDTLNDYYDPALKRARLRHLAHGDGFSFHQVDVSDREAMSGIAEAYPEVTHIVHLAAQAGVRYSLVDPYAYVTANVMGQVVLLETARRFRGLRHLVYASSSSVYGRNTSLPFRETDAVDSPGSFYAVTKRADELAAQSYAHLHGLPLTGLRFFTVYGPWGRPDMACYGFAQAIAEGRPVTLYEGEGLARDFTYIDDVVAGVLGVLMCAPPGDAPRILNIGNDAPSRVRHLVALLEAALGRRAVIDRRPRPAADMERTWACLDAIRGLTGWAPCVELEEGVGRFVAWFRAYHAYAAE